MTLLSSAPTRSTSGPEGEEGHSELSPPLDLALTKVTPLSSVFSGCVCVGG